VPTVPDFYVVSEGHVGPSGPPGPAGAAGGTPAIQLLNTWLPSGSGSVSFEDVFSDTFEDYLILLSDLCGSANATLSMQFLDQTNTLIDPSLSRIGRILQLTTSLTATEASASTQIPLTDGSTADFASNDIGLSGEVRVVRPHAHATYRSWLYRAAYWRPNAGPPIAANLIGNALTSNSSGLAVYGFRLVLGSGTFSRGRVTLYGYRFE
jgi:hypothetical protein